MADDMPMMDTSLIEAALLRLCQVFEWHQIVEILIVGGAAGMITGQFARGRTTTDCDVMVYAPERAFGALERCADEVGAALGLAAGWFNSNVQLRRDALPDGWMRRRIFVCEGPWLRVFAASRPDLIAMKVLAGRARDVVDIESMHIRADEVEFVRTFLDALAAKGTPPDQIADARVLLGALRTYT